MSELIDMAARAFEEFSDYLVSEKFTLRELYKDLLFDTKVTYGKEFKEEEHVGKDALIYGIIEAGYDNINDLEKKSVIATMTKKEYNYESVNFNELIEKLKEFDFTEPNPIGCSSEASKLTNKSIRVINRLREFVKVEGKSIEEILEFEDTLEWEEFWEFL
jgi:hypothetical protein